MRRSLGTGSSMGARGNRKPDYKTWSEYSILGMVRLN
jgi:hypothetical protein